MLERGGRIREGTRGGVNTNGVNDIRPLDHAYNRLI